MADLSRSADFFDGLRDAGEAADKKALKIAAGAALAIAGIKCWECYRHQPKARR